MLYHIIILYNDKELKFFRHFNDDKYRIKKYYTEPFNKKLPIKIRGKNVEYSQIRQIMVFESTSTIPKDLILPNGKTMLEEKDVDYLIDVFCLKQVSGIKGLLEVTPEFIVPSNPDETPIDSKSMLKQRRKIFIVHGSDEASAHKLKDHLTKKGINAEMFEDFKERITGNTTVIEELIKIKDEISYAFVIASADDIEKLNSRTMQNVLFEYGLFLGVLGRAKVECLWDKKIGEEPSYIKGVINIHFEKTIRETFPEIDAKIDKIR